MNTNEELAARITELSGRLWAQVIDVPLEDLYRTFATMLCSTLKNELTQLIANNPQLTAEQVHHLVSRRHDFFMRVLERGCLQVSAEMQSQLSG